MSSAIRAALPGALVFLSLISPAHARAAENDERLEETVVTATRTPQAVEALAASVIVIDRTEIERTLAFDIGEVLARQTGIEIARNGGPGQAASMFLRGTNSDHTLVMVDGVRINPGTLGGAALHNIAPETVERIEVVKGPRSTLWGTDAIGGVVNVFTRASAAQGFGVTLAGGSDALRSLQADGGWRFADRGLLAFSAGATDSDGFPTLRTSDVDRGYRQRNANLHGAWQASDAVRLGATLWHAEGTSEYLDFFAAPVAQDYRNQSLRLDADIRSGDTAHYRIALLGMTDEIRQLDAADFVRTRRVGLDAQGDWRLHENLLLSAGVVLNREDTESLSFGSGFDERTSIQQAYTQLQYQRGRQRGAVAAGVVDHPAFGEHVTWNAEYGLALGGGVSVAVAAGTAFKAPDATDRFGFGANPALQPERSRQYEVSLRQRLSERQSWQVAAYRNTVDDLINYVVTNFLTFDGRNENIDRARIEGIEFSYQLHGDTWHLALGAALADPRDLGSGQQLLRRARENYSLAAARRFGRIELSGDLRVAGARLDFGFPAPTRMDRYLLLGLGASYEVTPDWTLQLRIENALEEDYELAVGYRTPGRAVTLATRYRFR